MIHANTHPEIDLKLVAPLMMAVRPFVRRWRNSQNRFGNFARCREGSSTTAAKDPRSENRMEHSTISIRPILPRFTL